MSTRSCRTARGEANKEIARGSCGSHRTPCANIGNVFENSASRIGHRTSRVSRSHGGRPTAAALPTDRHRWDLPGSHQCVPRSRRSAGAARKPAGVASAGKADRCLVVSGTGDQPFARDFNPFGRLRFIGWDLRTARRCHSRGSRPPLQLACLPVQLGADLKTLTLTVRRASAGPTVNRTSRDIAYADGGTAGQADGSDRLDQRRRGRLRADDR